jgi:hypothetical protein
MWIVVYSDQGGTHEKQCDTLALAEYTANWLYEFECFGIEIIEG